MRYVPLEYYNNRKSGKVKNNDILMCKDGALTGKIGIIDMGTMPQKNVMVNEHLYILRANEYSILQKYLYFILASKEIYSYIQEITQKSAQPGLNNNDLKSIKIPLPSLEEQKSIVDQLEKERMMIEQQKELITMFEKKIDDKLNSLWTKETDSQELETDKSLFDNL